DQARAEILSLNEKIERKEGDTQNLNQKIANLIWAILDDTKAIRQVLGDEWSYRLTVIIRAAMLSARPNIVASKDQFQHIDAYDASRYRPQIVKILEDGGLDTELYRALIDEVVFSRAEASKDARGTVTAEAIAGWKAELADAAEAADAEAPSKF